MLLSMIGFFPPNGPGFIVSLIYFIHANLQRKTGQLYIFNVMCVVWMCVSLSVVCRLSLCGRPSRRCSKVGHSYSNLCHVPQRPVSANTTAKP